MEVLLIWHKQILDKTGAAPKSGALFYCAMQFIARMKRRINATEWLYTERKRKSRGISMRMFAMCYNFLDIPSSMHKPNDRFEDFARIILPPDIASHRDA
jgi:hypothetical protein